MRHFILLLCFICSSMIAQTNQDYSEHVTSLNSTLETLYSVISGEKGEARDWEKFKYLFHPDAKLIPTGASENGLINANFMTNVR